MAHWIERDAVGVKQDTFDREMQQDGCTNAVSLKSTRSLSGLWKVERSKESLTSFAYDEGAMCVSYSGPPGVEDVEQTLKPCCQQIRSSGSREAQLT